MPQRQPKSPEWVARDQSIGSGLDHHRHNHRGDQPPQRPPFPPEINRGQRCNREHQQTRVARRRRNTQCDPACRRPSPGVAIVGEQACGKSGKLPGNFGRIGCGIERLDGEGRSNHQRGRRDHARRPSEQAVADPHHQRQRSRQVKQGRKADAGAGFPEQSGRERERADDRPTAGPMGVRQTWLACRDPAARGNKIFGVVGAAANKPDRIDRDDRRHEQHKQDRRHPSQPSRRFLISHFDPPVLDIVQGN